MKSFISENIARDVNLEFAHHGLMRSVLHRQNVLDPYRKNCGIGIQIIDQNTILVVELFSEGEFTSKKIPFYREEIFSFLNTVRKNNGRDILVFSDQMSDLAQQWSTIMAENHFIGYTYEDGSINSLVKSSSLQNNILSLLIGASSLSDIINTLQTRNEFMEDGWNYAGIGIAQNDVGEFAVTVLYQN